MPIDTETLLQEQAGRTDALVAQLQQFFGDPARQQEASALPNAQADQAFNSLTGQFQASSRNNAFDVAARGLGGGSQEQARVGSLNRAFQGGTAQIESERQRQIFQNQARQQQQYDNALASAFSQNPYTQAGLGAINQAFGNQGQQAQQFGLLSQQNQAMTAQGNAQLGQALGNPLNLWASAMRAQQGG